METNHYSPPKEIGEQPELVEQSEQHDQTSALTLQVDTKSWIAMVYTAIAMVAIYYFGKSNHGPKYFPSFYQGGLTIPEYEFNTKLYWLGFGIIFYFIIPWVIIRLTGGRLRDYGVRLPKSYSHLWIYGAMLAIVIFLAYQASFQESFLKKYPYYKNYEAEPMLYALFWVGRSVRFFALEFFFRGYLLFALRKKMGDAAFFVSMIPYCMLHFGKPLPETIFAIIGGIIFCWIASRTESIWGAVVLHVSLALAMDFFAIAQKLNWI